MLKIELKKIKIIERNNDKLILDVLDGLFLIICCIFDWIEKGINKEIKKENDKNKRKV